MDKHRPNKMIYMSDNSTEIDCLFVHVMKKIKGNENCRFLSRGMIAFADLLEKNGISSKIVHLGIEKSRNCNFDIVEYIKNHKVKILGISIHWNHQLFSALEIIRKVKKEIKDINILVGGFTATFFAKEIMKNFKEVDFLIRGDAEIPLLLLVKQIIKGQKDFSDIPNLLWRVGKKIKENDWNYVASNENLNNLEFSNFSLFKNFEFYLRGYFNKGILGDIRNYLRYLSYGRIFFLITGRGCTTNCSYCGGSKISQSFLTKRPGMRWKSQKTIIRDLENLKKYRINNLWIVFNQDTSKKRYYIKLFKMIRKRKLRFKAVFDCCSIPSKEFINEFKLTFEKNSLIVFNPGCFSEDIRNKNKTLFYGNNDLLDTLDYIRHLGGIKVRLSFMMGLPFETKKTIYKTFKFCKNVLKRYKNVLVYFSTVEIDPVSPIYLYPSKYGVSIKRHDFSDFYDYSNERIYSIGYSTRNLSEKYILEISKLFKNYFKKRQSLRLIFNFFDDIYRTIWIF